MKVPPIPAEVAAAIADYPALAQRRLKTLRRMTYEVAGARDDVGELTETLKWGEPSFLPKRARVGTTVRFAWKAKTPEHYGMFVNCQTSLVDTFRSLAPELELIGNREIRVPLDTAPPEVLRLCIEAALTYHLNKRR